jgi:hypothetical protein
MTNGRTQSATTENSFNPGCGASPGVSYGVHLRAIATTQPPAIKGGMALSRNWALVETNHFLRGQHGMPLESLRTELASMFSPNAVPAREVPASRAGYSDAPYNRISEKPSMDPSSVAATNAATLLRRDFNLIRLILIEAEQPGGHPFRYDQYDRRMVQNHLMLLVEAGLLDGSVIREGNGLIRVDVERLTWAGHDLLAQIRDDALWQKAQACGVLDANGRSHLATLSRWLSSQISGGSKE